MVLAVVSDTFWNADAIGNRIVEQVEVGRRPEEADVAVRSYVKSPNSISKLFHQLVDTFTRAHGIVGKRVGGFTTKEGVFCGTNVDVANWQ